MDFKTVLSDICSVNADNQVKLCCGLVKLNVEVLLNFH